MISAIFRGQLGNQMFIAATTMAHAIKNDTTFAFPERSGKREQFPFYFRPLFPVVDRTSTQYLEAPIIQEKRFGVYQELPMEKDMILKGYWQNYRYFIDQKEWIRDKFYFFKRKHAITKESLHLLSDYVSLHIRRGDSLRFIEKLPQPTDKYLNEAMECFPGARFLVFTDDLDWCVERFKGSQFSFANPEDGAMEAMEMMSSCSGHIIVNSTFSWWGAFFGSNKVICPSEDSWFGDRYKHLLSAEGLMVPGWTQISYR